MHARVRAVARDAVATHGEISKMGRDSDLHKFPRSDVGRLHRLLPEPAPQQQPDVDLRSCKFYGEFKEQTVTADSKKTPPISCRRDAGLLEFRGPWSKL
jgi:hypothetical protein